MGLQTFRGKGPHWSLWAGSLAALGGGGAVIIIHNCLNYYEIYKVQACTQFINVTEGHIILTGRPRVGDSWCKPFPINLLEPELFF